jgi:hypothetical protein
MIITNLVQQSSNTDEHISRIDWWHLIVDDIPMVYQAIEWRSGYLIRTCFATFHDPTKAAIQRYVEVPYFIPLNTQNPQRSIEQVYKLALLNN